MITLVLPGSIRWLNLEDKPPPGRMPDLEDLADLLAKSKLRIKHKNQQDGIGMDSNSYNSRRNLKAMSQNKQETYENMCQGALIATCVVFVCVLWFRSSTTCFTSLTPPARAGLPSVNVALQGECTRLLGYLCPMNKTACNRTSPGPGDAINMGCSVLGNAIVQVCFWRRGMGNDQNSIRHR